MNCFEYYYFTGNLEPSVFEAIQDVLKEYDDFKDALVEGDVNFDSSKSLIEIWESKSKSGEDVRKSQVSWVNDARIYELLVPMIEHANQYCNWNFDLNKIEDLQYTRYGINGHYNWHTDENKWPHVERNTSIRKLSFTLLLNDEFEGGEFQMKLPDEVTMPLSKGDIIIFHSDSLHRVAPVTSGERRSLVGWIQGPPWR